MLHDLNIIKAFTVGIQSHSVLEGVVACPDSEI
jgi:hypothetical protein